MATLKLFEGMSPEQTMKKIEEERRKNKMEEVKRLIKGIVEDYYLWDMRCWFKYKDDREIREWIENGCKPNNCGHVVYCINELMNKHNFTVEQIIELIMRNPHKEYENRIVPCFKYPDICPRYQRCDGDYSRCECYKCE